MTKDEFIMNEDDQQETSVVTRETSGVTFSEGTVNLDGFDEGVLGPPPLIGVPRKGDLANNLVYDGNTIICSPKEKRAMIIVGNDSLYATAWDMEKNEQGDYFLPKFVDAADGVAQGYTRVYGKHKTTNWQNKEDRPNNVPAMKLLVLVEVPEELGGISFNGRHWVKGIMDCTRYEFQIAQDFLRMFSLNATDRNRKTWMLEWELSLYSRGDNYFMKSAFKSVHASDSDFAKEYVKVFGG